MRVFHDIVPADLGRPVYAIGNFDGLHRGHQALFAAALERAHATHVPMGVLTFVPHPVRVLAPQLAPPLILRDDEKRAGIAALGADLLVELPFDRALAAVAPRTFIDDVLVGRLHASGIVVGEGFRFGDKALGTTEDLRAGLAAHGATLDVVPSVRLGALVCSSTKIRELVLEGKVDMAAVLLGHPYVLEGVVVEGDRRGRTIQVPTANLDTGRELLPKVGVYATRTRLHDGRSFASVTNIGLRPTFDGQGVRIETHLLGFDGDLYGQRLTVDVISRIRDEQRFPNIDALRVQIARDIEAAKAALALASSTTA